MSDYILIQSRDPNESRTVERFYGLAQNLAGNGSKVTLFLLQDGVFAARESALSAALSETAKAGVEILADDFSLRERGIDNKKIISGVASAALDIVVDHMAAGRKPIWI